MAQHPRTDGYYYQRAVILSALRFYPEDRLAVGYCSNDSRANPVHLLDDTQKLDYIRRNLNRSNSDAWRGVYNSLPDNAFSVSPAFSLDLAMTTTMAGGSSILKILAFGVLNENMLLAQVVNPGIPDMPSWVQTTLKFQACEFVR